MFFSDVLDDNKGDGKVGRPDKQVADDIQPAMKICPPAAMPAGWEIGDIKQFFKKVYDLAHMPVLGSS